MNLLGRAKIPYVGNAIVSARESQLLPDVGQILDTVDKLPIRIANARQARCSD